VLIDTGSHTLDRVLWWFDGAVVTLEAYEDNAHGGVESDCVLHLSLAWRGRTIPVRVELSRTRRLRNTFQVLAAHGWIETPVNVPHQAWLSDRRLGDAAPMALDLRPGAAADHQHATYFVRQLQDFCAAVRTGTTPRNAAATALPVVRLIEQCYAARAPLAEPWVQLGRDQPLLDRAEVRV
jgi:predicted dehydrogenase